MISGGGVVVVIVIIIIFYFMACCSCFLGVRKNCRLCKKASYFQFMLHGKKNVCVDRVRRTVCDIFHETNKLFIPVINCNIVVLFYFRFNMSFISIKLA